MCGFSLNNSQTIQTNTYTGIIPVTFQDRVFLSLCVGLASPVLNTRTEKMETRGEFGADNFSAKLSHTQRRFSSRLASGFRCTCHWCHLCDLQFRCTSDCGVIDQTTSEQQHDQTRDYTRHVVLQIV